MRCVACNSIIEDEDLKIDDSLCPECYECSEIALNQIIRGEHRDEE